MKISDIQNYENNYELLTHGNFSKESVYKYAENIAKKYLSLKGKNWDADRYELDIHEFVNDLGGNINCFDIDTFSQCSGSIYIHQNANFDIILPSYTSRLRDKFTLAHEMGHYFLHFQKNTIHKKARRSGSGPIEWEANWFAASLLMPQELIDKKNLTANASSLAYFFDVSLEAAAVRLAK